MKYLPVNWQDGMKINKSHFEATEKAFRQEGQQRIQSFINAQNYGIFSPADGKTTLDWFLKNDISQETVLSVTVCKGVTENGAFIEVSPDQQQSESFRRKTNDLIEQLNQHKKLYVFLNINNYQRKPSGNLMDKDSSRRPYTIPTSSISVGTLEHRIKEFGGDTAQLTIGRLILKGGDIEKDKRYIPPTNAIAAYPILEDSFDNWYKVVNILLKNGKKTLQKIRNAELASTESIEFRSSGEKVSTTNIFKQLTKSTMLGLAELKPEIHQVLKVQPLVNTLTAIQKFAWKVRVNCDFFSSAELNTMTNYLKEMVEAKDLITVLDDICTYTYDHEKSTECVSKINQFWNYFVKIYDKENGLPSKNFSWVKGTVEVEDSELDIIIDDNSLSD